MSGSDSVGRTHHRRAAGHNDERDHSADGVFAGACGAIPVDVAVDGALSQVLQPLPFAHARARSSKWRVADRATNPAGDPSLSSDITLGVVFESVCFVIS